ncbi:hypothetical protein CSIRO_0913 [Bradyrhizobiaceae bacterium SG-6C]|nr:hypothetical protein CSIRO_0913 [Bradyrhizobiaceae bacterium SG-6C]
MVGSNPARSNIAPALVTGRRTEISLFLLPIPIQGTHSLGGSGAAMEIKNQGRGIHAREVHGVEKLSQLPSDWYAFTNLELTIGPGQSREIDLVMITPDRVLLVDLKDWNGAISAGDGRWFHNGRDMGISPVAKIRENTRKIVEILKSHLKDRARQNPNAPKLQAPYFQGVVIQCGRGSLENIAGNEKSSAFQLNDFIKIISDESLRDKALGKPAFKDRFPLTASDSRWRNLFEKFFNVSGGGQFRSGRRRYSSYRATSDHPSFKHQIGIYQEFDVEDESVSRATGLLRRWDFSKAETRFQSEQGRNEIAGREKNVIAFLNDRNPEAETIVLQPRIDDVERTVGYWEIFEKRRRLKRLSDFISSEKNHLSRSNRVELARQIISRVKSLHDVDAAHLDIGSHSIWLELPSTVRLSHLFAARYPEVTSLAEHRYQFLSSAIQQKAFLSALSDPFKQDCFLVGCAVHQLFFGVAPHFAGVSGEWDHSVDRNSEFSALYDWFSCCLSANDRQFPNASQMLDAFNAAFSEGPSSKQILERLERYRRWNSQRQLFQEFPSSRDIKSDDRVEIWCSEYDGQAVIVKMWKRAAWGEDFAEAGRLLGFLEKAELLKLTPPIGCARIREVSWLSDAIVILQDHLPHRNLSDVVVSPGDQFPTFEDILKFLKRLLTQIILLHEAGFSHGDLKPSNILVGDSSESEITFVDLIDLSPTMDGEIVSSAYAPIINGDRFTRDRFAALKIADELIPLRDGKQEDRILLAQAIQKCRVGPPECATLLPILEAIESILNPAQTESSLAISLAIKNAQSGKILSDEGQYGIRFSIHSPIVFIRGASEEIGIKLNANCEVVSGWRKSLEQKRISALVKHEFMYISGDLDVAASDHNEFSALNGLLESDSFKSAWKARSNSFTLSEPEIDQEEEEDVEQGDVAEDLLAEAIVRQQPTAIVDVPTLWRSLIDVEEELKIEGIASGDSTFRMGRRRHVLPFDLEEGTFDFNREDTVLIERLDRKGAWKELGILDISISSPSLLAIDCARRHPEARDGLIEEGTRLRFRSHFEVTSRSRREVATSRILSRQAVIPSLIETFSPDRSPNVSLMRHSIDKDLLQRFYKLNGSQIEAFERILSLRPLGLLQGPPGTGKTLFIGAIIHYALTHGLARNVLLASQAHEAVNNAAEAVLQLFKPDERPSIVRVGQEGSVSDELISYHSSRVEFAYKDRFRANYRERMRIVGDNLGLSTQLCDELVFIERSLRPTAQRYLEQLDQLDQSRAEGLRRTIETFIQKLDVPVAINHDLVNSAIQHVGDRHGVTDFDRVERFRRLFSLANDYLGSVSTQERSFETFLAGTRQMVAGTCVGLGRTSLGLTSTPFDLVVIDEAARCTASELAVPMQAGRWVILVGDHAQLEPLHRTEVVEQVAARTRIPLLEVKRSDFERTFNSAYGSQAGHRLTQQYRMLPPIGRIVSSSFYGGTLIHERSTMILDQRKLPKNLHVPLCWIATDGAGPKAYQRIEANGGTSLTNHYEADVIIRLLKEWDGEEQFRRYLRDHFPKKNAIGIICMYAAQCDLLRHKFRIAGFSDALRSAVAIGTVDSYQGKENAIVVLSLVRNNNDGAPEAGRATIRQGFLSRPNRINVALSRAMDQVVPWDLFRCWRRS